MTIDEAIEQFKYDAECNRADLDLSYAEDNEQVAEWLEELKAYRQYIDLTEIPEQYKLGFQDGIIAGNNKAIDDCLLVINANREKFIADICYSDLYDSIVQLKEGGNNGA